MRKTLVTGATGFIGRHLVRKLIGLNYRCRCMTRNLDTARAMWGSAVEAVEGDLTSPESVSRCVKGCTHVIHLGAQIGKWGLRRRDYEATNVNGTRNVIRACRAEGVKLLVHISTTGVAGIHGNAAADENTECAPITHYEASKLKAEREVLAACERGHVPAIVARLDFVYGPEDPRRIPLYATIRRGRFFLVGKGEALIRPTYVDDAVDGIIACLEHPECSGQIFNIGGPEKVSAREFVENIQRALGLEGRILFVPRFAAYAGALACTGISALIARAPILTVSRVRFWSMHHASSVDKASRWLGFSARTSLSEGMSRTISWFNGLGELPPTYTKLFGANTL